MNKYLKCAIAFLVAMVLVVGLVTCVASTPCPVVVETQAVTNRPLTPYLTYLESQDDADTWYILVDLSDHTNYPHVHTNRIILKSLRFAGDLGEAARWHYSVGVVTAVGDAATDIEWIWGGACVDVTQFDERWQLPEHGLSLSVVSASLDRVATFETTSTASVTTTTEISTTVGVTGTVGVGDLILFMDEISNTTTIDIFVSAGYDAE